MAYTGVTSDTYVLRPIARDHLLPVPVSFAEHELADARHVAGGKMDRVGGDDGFLRITLFLLQRAIEILHAERVREVALQSVVDILTGHLLESRPRRLEVPGRVDVIRPTLLATAPWPRVPCR